MSAEPTIEVTGINSGRKFTVPVSVARTATHSRGETTFARGSGQITDPDGNSLDAYLLAIRESVGTIFARCEQAEKEQAERTTSDPNLSNLFSLLNDHAKAVLEVANAIRSFETAQRVLSETSRALLDYQKAHE